VADGALPKFTVRSESAFAQFGEFLVREVNPRMNAQQLRAQNRLARSHQRKQRVLAFELLTRSPLLLQLARILSE